MKIQFSIPLEPFSKQSTRFSTKGGIVRSYVKPEKRIMMDNLMALVRDYIPDSPMEGAIKLTLKCYIKIPKSFPNWKKELIEEDENNVIPITRPDLDNYTKPIMDCLTKTGFWLDDSQVARTGEGFGKYYAKQPRIDVVIEQMNCHTTRSKRIA